MREPQMTTRQALHRRFNLADGLIVTAATATTLALLRALQEEWPSYVFIGGALRHYREAPLAVRMAMKATYVLIPWTVAIFLMRLRPPRPPLRRLVLQP